MKPKDAQSIVIAIRLAHTTSLEYVIYETLEGRYKALETLVRRLGYNDTRMVDVITLWKEAEERDNEEFIALETAEAFTCYFISQDKHYQAINDILIKLIDIIENVLTKPSDSQAQGLLYDYFDEPTQSVNEIYNDLLAKDSSELIEEADKVLLLFSEDDIFEAMSELGFNLVT
jgi:hypothetical protein